MAQTQVNNITADGIDIFYRSAGSPSSPPLLLLHGFPSSSHQYRNLLPLLANNYHVIAPDFPGFGFTNVPAARNYTYSFANLTTTLLAFLTAINLNHFAVYMFDYGAPIAFRLALQRPDAISAIISQNGNAYAEGLGPAAWAPLQEWWASGNASDREAIRAALLTFDSIKGQYTTGSPHPPAIQPEAYYLDTALINDRPGNQDIQLDLLYDYRTNVELYPQFQAYLRKSGVPVLAAWGKNDQFFIPAGAEAYRRDVKDLEIRFLDAGHFAVETNEVTFAELIRGFLKKRGI